MRAILMTMLLLVSVILIYTSVAAGQDGAYGRIERQGASMSGWIRSIDP